MNPLHETLHIDADYKRDGEHVVAHFKLDYQLTIGGKRPPSPTNVKLERTNVMALVAEYKASWTPAADESIVKQEVVITINGEVSTAEVAKEDAEYTITGVPANASLKVELFSVDDEGLKSDPVGDSFAEVVVGNLTKPASPTGVTLTRGAISDDGSTPSE